MTGSRVFMDPTGFKIAKSGFDARIAAEQDLLFSSNASSMTLYQTGVATLTDFAETVYGTPGWIWYRRAVITFGKTFAKPPMAFCAGLRSDGKIECGVFGKAVSASGGTTRVPCIVWVTTTTDLTIYVLRDQIYNPSLGWVPGGGGPDCTSARYYIMENTIE